MEGWLETQSDFTGVAVFKRRQHDYPNVFSDVQRAYREGEHGKRDGAVNALQRLLTRSLSGKALAVRRVTENRGKRTLGIDQVICTTPEMKAAAIQTLRAAAHHPTHGVL